MAKQSTKLPNPCLQFCFMKFIHEHTNKVPLDFSLKKENITDLAHLYVSLQTLSVLSFCWCLESSWALLCFDHQKYYSVMNVIDATSII